MDASEQTSLEPSPWRELWQKAGVAESAVALASFLVYLRSLTLGLVYDDHGMVQTPFPWSWSNVAAVFQRDISPDHAANFFRPLTTLWQGAVAWVAGSNAAAWHFSNLLLFALCTVLVFRLAAKLLGSRAYAVLAAALFLVHPTHVEAVTWISDAADSLLTIFLLLAALALLRGLQSARPAWLVLSWVAVTAGCLVKETGVIVPLLLLALVWWRGERLAQPRVVLTFAGYAISVLSFLAQRSQVLHGFSHPLATTSNAEMLLTIPAALWFYLSHLLLPLKLALFYPLALVNSGQSGAFLLPVFLLLVIAVAAAVLAVRLHLSRAALLFAAWVAVPLLPPLYLKLFPAFELVHDRYLFIPTIALGMGLAALLQHYEPKLRARGVGQGIAPLVALVLLAAAAETVAYQGAWADDLTLFTRAVETTPGNDRALVNLGVNQLQRGNVQEGAVLLQRALALNPGNALALFDLGNVAWNGNNLPAAASYFERAAAIEPHPEWLIMLAKADYRMNRFADVEQAASQALARNPAEPGAHFMLGLARYNQGDTASAAREFSAELSLFPQETAARQALQALGQEMVR
ncbi:MAG: tetratricopeptide repeat protein [Acidobacteriota bacterium]|nr:tetratricopeptide repeat protein [Acidobacteriota bacterium]